MRKHFGQRGQQGFTMVEVMLAVVIIGIIAAVSMPIYKESVQRSGRNQARSVLLEDMAWLERNNTTNNTYLISGKAPDLPFKQSPKNGAAKYNITITDVTASTFTLLATPLSGVDDKCGTFKIDQTGLKTIQGGSLSVDECWNGK
ncbi:MAG: type IV pilin protein [Burkholderiales bacterium]|nr:type IV pilin protein [Burkholderiales bacterium]